MAIGTENEASGVLGVPSTIVFVTIDRESCESTLIRSDGKEARLPISSATFAPTSKVRRVHWMPPAQAFLVETINGHDIAMRLADPDDPAPVEGRPVVYLDHNHWNTVYRARHQSGRPQSQDELAAARWLTDLADQDVVILPRSGQHAQETCQWSNDDERYLLGLTILQVSRGWQMRDPLQIRLEELRASLTMHYRHWPTTPPAAITLEGAIHSAQISPPQAPSYFPRDAAHTYQQVVAAMVDIDVMLDAETVPAAPQFAWAAKNQGVTDRLRAHLNDREATRRNTDRAFISDIRTEIARVADELRPTERQFAEWVQVHLPEEIASMPCLGLSRELLHDKTVAGVRWEPNDLIDTIYLTAAAGHCDHVVAEREVCAQLRQGARRLNRQVRIHPNLRDLRRSVEDTGWSTAVTSPHSDL